VHELIIEWTAEA